MPPHIIRLGREPLSGEHKAVFEAAVRRSNGKIHVITHPTSLEVPMDMMRTTEFKDAAVMAQTGNGLVEKIYEHGDMMRAFADKYSPRIHRILAAEEPKIVFVEEKDLGTVEARIRNGWMKPISDFSKHVSEGNKPLLTSSDANSTIVIVPTMLKDPTPIHGWGALEKTLGGVNMPKSLEISGTYIVTDPRDGSVMRACPTEIRDQLQRRRSAIGASSIRFNREAGFPDIEGLNPKKHTFHEGRVRSDFGTFIMPHKPGFADAALAQVRSQILEKPGQQQALQAKKIGRNDPCPCGSGVKYKKCHGG